MKKASIILLLSVMACIFFLNEKVVAAFNPSNIISDGIFTNKNTMSQIDIKNFIDAKGAGCVNGEAPCLKNFSENGKSASQIIYEAAQTYSINPQTLLSTLQKETGLLTKSTPGAWRYKTAMGYGCPDSTPGVCDSTYFGFTNQINWASKMFRSIMDAKPTWYSPFVIGNNYIAWNPESVCGGSTVNIENRATQALYSYTPYQPNAAALRAGYGEGDSCSSYGNRNFYNYFSDWFGNPTIEGRIYVEQLDSVSDIDGEPGKIGFRLNFRPDYPVTVLLAISNSQVLGSVGNVDRVVIQPNDWDSPEKNIVTVYGKDDGSATTKQVYLQTTEVASYDPRFDLLSGSDVGDPSIIVQSGTRDIFRLYSPSLNRHIYTSRADEVSLLLTQGYRSEGTAFYACEAGSQNIARISKSGISLMVDMRSSEYKSAISDGFRLDGSLFSVSNKGTVAVYRLRNQNNNYLYTTSVAERDMAVSTYGYTFEGQTFTTCEKSDKPVFRLMNTSTGNHFYTKNPSERDYAGSNDYISEGEAFYIPLYSDSGQVIYRLYNRQTKSHFYTSDEQEKQAAQRMGYTDEGIAFAIPSPSSNIPIYRLFSSIKKEHFYTQLPSERDTAVNSGLYVNEGTAFIIRP